ncbi:phosphotransferase [Roseibium album]|uniref:Phosphotransferase enzyme family protein n=1 Tax=Roseibium album TaxID=311410 RepID=A0A0M7B1Q9_9HYPH|nr:phosphotransferase [Roseibium album]CTQ63402.1 Phosphotransferase enzyme family protein [Roseibium album]CTQ79473.1 Phosphotransferase enzyme family protein [Roseibium album]CTQ80989.1 Phosphotransferase enzyme family protein [Roseibium album]
MNNCLRAVYFDDEVNVSGNWRDIWEETLGRISEKSDVVLTSKFDAEEIEKHKPHIVIVDNVVSEDIYHENVDVGANFIAKYKDKYPEIVFILFTQASFSIKTLGNIYPNPDILIPKTHILNEKYREKYIAPRIKQLLKRMPIENVHFSHADERRDQSISVDTIRVILEQCLFSATRYGKKLIDDVSLSVLHGGKSGASVYLANVSGIDQRKNVPCVFRLTAKQDIEEEVANYKQYAWLQMPHNSRVELLGEGYCGETGGALYAFALGRQGNATTLTKIISEKDEGSSAAVFEAICKRIFGLENIGWYESFPESDELPVGLYFSNRTEYAPEKDNRRYSSINRNYSNLSFENNFSIDSEKLVHSGQIYQVPRNLIDKWHGDRLKMCVCHGDLNTNNIITREKLTKISLIDFEYTGVDHIFKDYISLEVSARCYAHEFAEVTKLEDAIKYERERISKFKLVDTNKFSSNNPVDIIRREFLFNNPKLNQENIVFLYLLCLSFHLQKVLALSDWSQAQFSCLLGSFIATLEELSD